VTVMIIGLGFMDILCCPLAFFPSYRVSLYAQNSVPYPIGWHGSLYNP